jgi:hypothetical protein
MDRNPDFHNEWYHSPWIERPFWFLVQGMRLITHPYIMPFWVFALVFLVGGQSLIFSLLLSAAVFVVGWKVWVGAEKEAEVSTELEEGDDAPTEEVVREE